MKPAPGGEFMAKSDVADAFRLIPLHPSQHHFAGFSWEGNYYYDKCLPQGGSSSCQKLEQLSSALMSTKLSKCLIFCI